MVAVRISWWSLLLGEVGCVLIGVWVGWAWARWAARRPLVEGLGLPVGRILIAVRHPKGRPVTVRYRVNEPGAAGRDWWDPVVYFPDASIKDPAEILLEVDRVTTGEVDHRMPDGRTVRWRPAGRRWVEMVRSWRDVAG